MVCSIRKGVPVPPLTKAAMRHVPTRAYPSRTVAMVQLVLGFVLLGGGMAARPGEPPKESAIAPPSPRNACDMGTERCVAEGNGLDRDGKNVFGVICRVMRG